MLRVTRPGSDSRSLLRRIVEQESHLLRVQACRTTRSRARGERRNRAMSAAMRGGLVARSAHAHGYSRANVIAQRDRAQELCAADAELFARCESCWHHGHARMRA